jgi:predicted O-linked N-acetylglucosamine transferase (SPINDLY family)
MNVCNSINAETLLQEGINYSKNINLLDKALTVLLKARELDPNLPSLNFTLGRILKDNGQYYKSYAFFKHELEISKNKLNPEVLALLYHQLMWTCSYLGKIEEACQYGQESIKLQRSNFSYYNDLIFFMHHAGNSSDQTINQLAKDAYRNCLEYPLKKERACIEGLMQKKKIPMTGKVKIGILSPYLHASCAESFFADMVSEINQDEFELHFFYDGDTQDHATTKFIQHGKSFNNVKNQSALEIAQLIVQKDIDLLLDSLGHIKGNRLDVFSLKPAPIQASFLVGYWGSTGLPQIDYHISQSGWISNETKNTFTEEIIEIPHLYLKSKITDIKISKAPCLNSGYITFGAFNRGQKISPKLLSIWSIILSLLPNSKLILSYHALQEDTFKEEMLKFFLQKGISRERITLLGKVSSREYFNLFNKIDIALDSFPFSGGCTSIDTLWMSTPLITKKDDKIAGKFSESFLNILSAPELIAKDEEEYIMKALELGKNFSRIAEYKNTLREKLLNSGIFDAKISTNHLETAFRTMINQARKKQKND